MKPLLSLFIIKILDHRYDLRHLLNSTFGGWNLKQPVVPASVGIPHPLMRATRTFLLGYLFSAWGASAQSLLLKPANDGPEAPSHRLAWSTQNGIRYQLEKSPDLIDWDVVDGFPRASDSPADQLLLDLNEGSAFFRMSALDEQPPDVTGLSPEADGFGVPARTPIVVVLSDVSGIDPNSVALHVGGGPAIGLDDPRLTLNEGVLTYTPGNTPHGVPGATVSVTVEAADPLGHAMQRNWSFDLELDPVLAEVPFVFGSDEAVEAGQSPPDGSPAPDPDNAWEIEEVTEDTLVIHFAGEEPAVFTVGMLVCNMAPATTAEIFYRRIGAIVPDLGASRITLETMEADIGDFIQQGSFSVSRSSLLLDPDNSQARKFDYQGEFSKTLPSIGGVYSGEEIFSAGGLEVSLSNAELEIRSNVAVSVQIEDSDIKRFKANLDGVIEGRIGPQLSATGELSYEGDTELFDAKRHILVMVPTVPPIPLWITVEGNVAAFASASVSASATIGGGFSQSSSFSFNCDYKDGREPAFKFDSDLDPSPVNRNGLSYQIEGEAEAEAGFRGVVGISLWQAAGFTATVDPRFGFTGEASFDPEAGRRARWELYARADFSLDFFIKGLQTWNLYEQPIYRSSWIICEPTEEEELVLGPSKIVSQVGETVEIIVKSCAPEGTVFEWFHNGNLIPDVTGDSYVIEDVDESHDGDYTVRAVIMGVLKESNVATLKIGAYKMTYEVIETETEPEIEVGIDLGGGYIYYANLFAETSQVGEQLVQFEEWEFDDEAGEVRVTVLPDGGVEEDTYTGSYNAETGEFEIQLDSPPEIVSVQPPITYYNSSTDRLEGTYDPEEDVITGRLTWTSTSTWSHDNRGVSCTTVEKFRSE